MFGRDVSSHSVAPIMQIQNKRQQRADKVSQQQILFFIRRRRKSDIVACLFAFPRSLSFSSCNIFHWYKCTHSSVHYVLNTARWKWHAAVHVHVLNMSVLKTSKSGLFHGGASPDPANDIGLCYQWLLEIYLYVYIKFKSVLLYIHHLLFSQ